ncbi:MAG: hypothetical protein AAGI07_09590 [Bacteroidota bacterium]
MILTVFDVDSCTRADSPGLGLFPTRWANSQNIGPSLPGTYHNWSWWTSLYQRVGYAGKVDGRACQNP